MSAITKVRLPDGTTINVQTDDPQVAAAAARKHWANKAPRANSAWENFQDRVINNVLPNWGDEIAGTGYALGSVLSGKRGWSEGFREGQRRFNANQQSFERERPKTAALATGTGMVAGLALPAGGALKGANLAQKVRQGARVGALYGAVAGAGEGEGLDLPRRATNAATSAVTGAAAGALLPVGVAGAQRLGRAARMHVPGVDRAVTATSAGLQRMLPPRLRRAPADSAAVQQANLLAATRMHEGTIANGLPHAGPQASPQAIAAEVERRNQVGVPAMIGDVSQPMRELTQWSSRGVGPGQQMVRDSLERRQATQGTRVRQHVQDTFPTTPDPIEFVEASKRQAREAAAPLYEQAYAQPMQVTKDINGITQTPAFRDALPQAHRNIQNQIDPATGLPKDPSAMGLRWFDGEPGSLAPGVPYAPAPGGGYVAMDQTLSTEGFDQVARAMSDSGRAASHVNPVTGRLESTTNSVHINSRSRDLKRHMGEQNEPYRAAVEGFGDDMTQVSAFQQGGDVARLTGAEINAQRQALPDVAHETWSTGAGTAMADAASQYGAQNPTGNVARHVKQTLGDDLKQAALSEITGNNGAVRNLQDRLEFENQGHLNYRGAYGNSSTAANQQLDNDLGQMASAPFTANGIKDRLINFVASHAAPRFQRDVKERIAQIATASDAQSVQGVMDAIEAQARSDRSFGDLLHKAGVGATATYGRNIQPVDPVEMEEDRGY